MREACVLGVDPGFASMGMAVLRLSPSGDMPVYMTVFRTRKSDRKRRVLSADDDFRRACELANFARHAFASYQPVAVCSEAMSYPRNSASAAKIGMSIGIVAALATQHGLPCLQISPQALKQRLCGNKSAAKAAVLASLAARYPEADFDSLLRHLPATEMEHAWDALGSVVACLDSTELRTVRKMLEED